LEILYGLTLIVTIVVTILILSALEQPEREYAGRDTLGRPRWREVPRNTTAARLVGAAIIFPCFLLIVNNYLGNERIDAVVQAVNKKSSSVERVSVDFSGGIEQERTNEILQPYEVAVTPIGAKNLVIINNDNTLWRAKFNKREIQLQLEPGKKYRIYVHRLVFGKNILKAEEL
jgi:hypothetical protein